MATHLTPHFTLDELVSKWFPGPVPFDVLENLEKTATLLERVRWIVRELKYSKAVIMIHSGYRPPRQNQAAGGVSTSDHALGLAADFHVEPREDLSWQAATLWAFPLIREELKGEYGQLILEDRRKHEGRPGALLLHISVPTPKHPGKDDPASVLISSELGVYRPWTPSLG